MRRLKTLLVGAAIALALAATSATAGAFRVTIDRGGPITAASLGPITFEGGGTINCNVTLNGLLLGGPINVAAGEKIGEITEVRTASCSGGSIRAILVGTGASAWPVTINSVPGGLPNSVTSIELLIRGASFNLLVFGGFVECLYRGDVPASLALRATATPGKYTTGLLSLLANTLSFVRGSGLCPSSGSMRGTFSLSPARDATFS